MGYFFGTANGGNSTILGILFEMSVDHPLDHDGAAVSFRWNGGSNTSRVEPASNAGMNTSTSD